MIDVVLVTLLGIAATFELVRGHRMTGVCIAAMLVAIVFDTHPIVGPLFFIIAFILVVCSTISVVMNAGKRPPQ